MNPSISVIVPGIRSDRWFELYNSILNSTKRSFELIICGPYFPDSRLANFKNFKFVRDFGSPVRASMIAASIAEGDFITWGADDGLFLQGSLDGITNLSEKDDSITVCKYLEGENGKPKILQPNEYFLLNGSHWTASQHFNNNWYLFNTGIMSKSKFLKLGGWDCIFEGTFYSHSDLAARAYIGGENIKFVETLLLDCDHFPGGSYDHGPIEDAQTNYDYHIFKNKYNRIKVNPTIIKKWDQCSPVWERRFSK